MPQNRPSSLRAIWCLEGSDLELRVCKISFHRELRSYHRVSKQILEEWNCNLLSLKVLEPELDSFQ